MDTLISCGDYSQLLLDQGKPRDAERELRGAVAIARDVLGGDNSTKLALISSLARSLQVQGRLAEAQPQALENLECRRRSVGNSPPTPLMAILNYAQLLADSGRLSEAEPLMCEALAGFQRVLGAGHAHTRSCAASLEALLRAKAAAAAPGAQHRVCRA